MAELILYAIPAFVLLLVVELLSFKYARDDDPAGYEARDTRTSLFFACLSAEDWQEEKTDGPHPNVLASL